MRALLNELKEMYEGMTHKDGVFSHTRAWSSIAYAVASFIIIKLTIMGGMNPEYLLIYMATAAGHNSISKYLSMREKESYNFQPERIRDVPID